MGLVVVKVRAHSIVVFLLGHRILLALALRLGDGVMIPLLDLGKVGSTGKLHSL